MSRRPNVLLLHWHDLGRHLGAYGAASVDSPNVDRLAAEGIRFDRAFATAPVCSPSRGSLFTGRYPHANGLMGLSNLGWEYAPGERTLPELLRDAGYRTALIGLQHESWHAERTGFEELHAVGEAITHDFRYCGIVAEAAEAWLDDAAARSDERPFFASVGFWETHRPWPAERYAPDDPAAVDVPPFLPDNRWTRDDLAGFQSSIRTADAALGRVLAALERNGLADDTWVIFTTDHGIAFPGAKSSLFDAGLGVALVMRLPAAWDAPRGPTDRLHSHVDLVPTILEAVGAPVPEHVQGVSHAAWLTGRSEAAARDRVFGEQTFHDAYDPMRSIRTERFKYVRSYEERPRLVLPGDFSTAPVIWGYGSDHLRHRPAEQLYDLAADPFERHDLGADPAHADVRAELAAELRRWQEETGDPLLAGPVEAPPAPRIPQLGALPD